MTPRERWLNTLSGKPIDHVVMDIWATGEVMARLRQDLHCATDKEVQDRLHIDRPMGVGAKRVGGKKPDGTFGDLWGLSYQQAKYGTGEYSEVASHPLAWMHTADDVAKHPWPSADWFDFSVITEQLTRAGDRCVQCGGYEPFLLYCSLRGMEQAYEDLLENEDLAEAILERIFTFHYELNRRSYEAGRGRIDMTYVAEDLGGQTSLLISPPVYRRFLKERQRKMIQLAKSHGIHVFYHTDGAARPLVPELIEIGIEVLNPVQWRCPGMEREGLVRDFGKQIAFHGAVDNQQTLPFGTPEDVRKEVRENLEIFKDCRYILAPCHNLQPVTPTANIVAMYEEGWLRGWR